MAAPDDADNATPTPVPEPARRDSPVTATAEVDRAPADASADTSATAATTSTPQEGAVEPADDAGTRTETRSEERRPRTAATTLSQRDPGIDAAAAMFRGACYVISDVTDIGTPLVEVAPSFDTLTGYTALEALGRNLGFLQHADTDQEGIRALREAQRDGEPCTVILRAYRRDGSMFWCEQQHFPIPDANGRTRYYVTLLRDVSDRVHREVAERATEAMATRSGGVDATYDYTILVEGSGGLRLLWISDAVGPITGTPSAAIRENGLSALVHPDDWDRFERRALRIAETARDRGRVGSVEDALPPERGRYRVRGGEGAAIWVEDATSVAWMASSGFQVALHGRVGRSEDPAPGAHGPGGGTDGLTDLPDVNLFLDRMQQAIYRARRSGEHVAVALLDLQTFGFVNATFGRSAGDRVLRRVAQRLATDVRKSDTLARVDGDTFGLVLPELTAPDDALPALEKILGALAAPLEVADPDASSIRSVTDARFGLGADASRILSDNGATLTLSAVVGVATYPDGAVQVAGELYERASAALAAAKRRGEHLRFYQADLDSRMRDRISLRSDLGRAVRSDELVLHFQPRLSLKTGEITSFEGLVRWAHPSRGLLKPAAFLADAEASPIGSELFTWVLERGVAQARAWQERGVPRRVAVNVGPRALARDDFVDVVTDALSRHDLHPSLLELELVEGTDMELMLAARERLARLRDSGVRVALDDFGAAYASLAHLEALPLDSLKIDRAVIGAVREDGEHDPTELLAAIVAIGRSLDLSVVAEGVETVYQERLLKELACDEVQGFLHGKALPAHLISPTGEPLQTDA